MSVLYKRLVLFVAFALLIIALRIFDNGLCSINGQGRYTAFLQNGDEIVYDNIPLFNERGAYERIDFSGNKPEPESESAPTTSQDVIIGENNDGIIGAENDENTAEEAEEK